MDDYAGETKLKIFVSIRKDTFSEIEYKKIILMVDGNKKNRIEN